MLHDPTCQNLLLKTEQNNTTFPRQAKVCLPWYKMIDLIPQLPNATVQHMCLTHRPQTAQMREQKPQMPQVCKGPGQSCFGRRHAPTRCIRTCIVLEYAHSNTTGPSIPNSKTFKHVWAILQLSRPKPNSKEVKVQTKRS